MKIEIPTHYAPAKKSFLDMLKENEMPTFRILTNTANYLRVQVTCSRKLFDNTIQPAMNILTVTGIVTSYAENWELTETKKEGHFYRYILVCRMWNNSIDGEIN